MKKENVSYTYTMEYCLAFKKRETLPFATTWMNLECIMLSEISQTQRQILYNLAYTWDFKKSNSQNQSRIVFARGWRVGGMEKYWSKVQSFIYT